jgi:hypothetical protein
MPPIEKRRIFLTVNTKKSGAVGCIFHKEFDSGRYRGIVVHQDTNGEPTWYHVRYEDGDEEDLTWEELKEHARVVTSSSSSSAQTKKTKLAKTKPAKTKPDKAVKVTKAAKTTKATKAKKMILTMNTKPVDYIGCTFYKSFAGQSYAGVVEMKNGNWYHVKYNDGDEEDLTVAELRECAREVKVSSSSSSGAPAAKKKRGRPVKTLELNEQPSKKTRTIPNFDI